MDNQDQTNTIPSGQENHGVHICNRCGWPFPNPHPSARHRRAHKKICGTIEGYKILDLQQHTHLAVSDDEHPSDEEKQTPSPKIEKRSIKEFVSGGIGEKSGRSEDEVFSDAVTEFSDSGASPGVEERFVGERDSDKNVDKAVVGDVDSSALLKIAAIAGTTELVNSPPIESSKVDLEVLENPDNKLLLDNAAKDVEKIEKYEVDNVLADVAEPAKVTVCKSSDAEIKLEETGGKISDPLRAVGVEQLAQVQSDGHGDTIEVSDTKGQGEETVHYLPVVDHSDTLLEGFKDNGAVKSNIPVILESGEVIRSLEEGNKDTNPEINSSADVDTVVDDFEQEREAKIQGNSLDENVSSLDTISKHTETELFDAIPTVTSVHKEGHFETKLTGDGCAHNCEVEKFVPVRDESREGVAEKQLLEINKSTLESVEDRLVENKVDQDSGLLGENDMGDQQKLIHEHSDVAPVERTGAVATDEDCAGNTNEKFESEQQCLELTYIDNVSVSTEIGIGASNLENITQNHPNSQKGPNEDSQEVVKEPEIDNDYKVVPESIGAVAIGSESKHNGDVPEKVIVKEPGQLPNDMESSNTVEDSHSKDSDNNASGVVSKPALEEGNDNTSVHSSSQNSVEGNWGSVSVLSTQSDAQASIGNSKDNSRIVPDERHLDKSACVEDPSFMTLVESADQKAGPTEIEAVPNSQKAAWFPTLTNVNNESEGRKKNEEVIEKVTKWSTGKHNALKNLLGEANTESEVKSTCTQKDEAAAKTSAVLATSEKSDFPSEAPASTGTEKETGKEWSPEKYPADSKKDRKKVKGKPSWIPFVCCSSVNVN